MECELLSVSSGDFSDQTLPHNEYNCKVFHLFPCELLNVSLGDLPTKPFHNEYNCKVFHLSRVSY